MLLAIFRFLTLSFGGGGGDGGAAQIQAQQNTEDSRKAAARAAINRLFGIEPGMVTTPHDEQIWVPPVGMQAVNPADPQAKQIQQQQMQAENAKLFHVDPAGRSISNYGPVTSSDGRSISTLATPEPYINREPSYQPSTGKYEFKVPVAPTPIYSQPAAPAGHYENKRTFTSSPEYLASDALANLNAREAGYSELASRIRDYYMPGLTEDRNAAQRNLKFGLARAGQQRSSVDVDQNAQLGRNWDTALRNVSDTSLEATNRARSSDEQSRLGLMSAINTGLDQGSALAAATTQLQQSGANAADFVKGRTLGDFTNNIAYLNNANNVGIGRRDARQVYQQLFAPGAGTATGGNNGRVV